MCEKMQAAEVKERCVGNAEQLLNSLAGLSMESVKKMGHIEELLQGEAVKIEMPEEKPITLNEMLSALVTRNEAINQRLGYCIDLIEKEMGIRLV